ncbi:hypothetical protein [Magnetococcus sp. PR-3]|uniref:hypothetical protein n=1 Tax=Magnetococcus sp. PR-3 TaxID=3120355 RepID=UPI002FCDEF1A
MSLYITTTKLDNGDGTLSCAVYETHEHPSAADISTLEVIDLNSYPEEHDVFGWSCEIVFKDAQGQTSVVEPLADGPKSIDWPAAFEDGYSI